MNYYFYPISVALHSCLFNLECHKIDNTPLSPTSPNLSLSLLHFQMSIPTYLLLCQLLPNTPNLDLLNPLTMGKIIFSHYRMLIHSSHNIYTFHTICISTFSKQCSHSTYIFFYTNKHKTQNYIQSVSIMLDVAKKKKKTMPIP